MNIYKYAKRHADGRLDISLILAAHRGSHTKSECRLLMVHWLAWYYHFVQAGDMDLAKRNMRNLIEEVMFLSHYE